MEAIQAFFTKFKVQVKDIYDKHNEDNSSVIVVNYENLEDIKVSCLTLDKIDGKILVQLENIRKNTKCDDYSKLAVTMNKSDINIVKYIE